MLNLIIFLSIFIPLFGGGFFYLFHRILADIYSTMFCELGRAYNDPHYEMGFSERVDSMMAEDEFFGDIWED